MIQCGVTFLSSLQNISTQLSLGYATGPITEKLFSSDYGLFSAMQNSLYLYLPILTMGLMSRETSSGSIKLLLSSPVKLRQIILGKFLAIIGYGLVLIGVLLVYVIIGACFIKGFDTGRVCSGLLGLYLLICTYAAIGLLMSCLTTYQVVAAISTLTVFAVLRYAGTLWQGVDFIRDLTYFLSISGRTEKMIIGLVTTRDVFYYLIIIATFLSFAVLYLSTERKLLSPAVKAGRYAVLAVAALMLGYLTSRPALTGYADLTADQSLTINKSSQAVAKQINGELKVTTYVNMLAPLLSLATPEARNMDYSALEPYKRFIPGMKTNYVYYYQKTADTNFRDYKYNPNLKGVTDVDKIAAQMAKNIGTDGSLFMPPAAIDKMIDLAPEGYLLVRELEYQGRKTFLRFYVNEINPYASEAEFTAALKRLLTKIPKVIFLTGNNERGIASKADRDYQLMGALKTQRTALINQGFDVDSVNLNQQSIPSDASIVVLADPTLAFSDEAQQRLSAYVTGGGNLLLAGEPGNQQLLNPLVKPLGLQFKPGILVKPDKEFTPGFINAELAPQSAGFDKRIDQVRMDHMTIAIQGAAAIDYDGTSGFSVKPLLLSTAGGWNKNSRVQEAFNLNASNQRFDLSNGDKRGIFPIAVSLTRQIHGKIQRIVVSGDADFMSNGELSRYKRGENPAYTFGLFKWLSNGVFPVEVDRPEPKDTALKIATEQITALTWLCEGVIPLIIAVSAAIFLLRRRRK